MSIGYDSAKVPDMSAVNDLLKPEYKGKVALNGDPTQAGAAFSGVAMVALSQGGSADDVAPGVAFFTKLKQAGNFLPVDPTPATIESGQTPVVIDWDYLNAAETKKLPSWKVFVPQGAVLGGYYFQAINKDAPHPAAARLWQEFLYSDEGQNLYLAGGARPVRADAMVKSRHHRRRRLREATPGQRNAGHPDPGPDGRRPPSTWPTTGPRRSADVVAAGTVTADVLRDALPLAAFRSVRHDLPDHPDGDGDRVRVLSRRGVLAAADRAAVLRHRIGRAAARACCCRRAPP